MVKTRLQSGAGYKGPVDAAQAILKNEGVVGFYRGAYADRTALDRRGRRRSNDGHT